MHWARPFALLSGLGWVALACTEQTTAPAACPEFCLSTEVVLVDTVMNSVVVRDSSFRGYVLAHRGVTMQVASPGGTVESRGLIEFRRFSEEILFDTAQAETRPVAALDSFRLTLRMRDRNELVPGLEVVVYRLPVGLDSTATFASTAAAFDPANVIGSVPVADTLTPDSVNIIIDGSAFPTFAADSQRVAIGVAIRGSAPTFASFGTDEANSGATLRRFARVDSAGTLVERSDQQQVAFDTFVRTAPTAAGDTALVVGETPSARALLRFDLPSLIIDSSDIVKATLLLVPVGAARGAPGDTFNLQANGLGADFGPKSPVVIILPSAGADSTALLGASVPVGSTDTVAIDVTTVIRNWQANDRPHSMMLRVSTEGGTLGGLLFASSRHPTLRPALQITFVTPFDFAGLR